MVGESAQGFGERAADLNATMMITPVFLLLASSSASAALPQGAKTSGLPHATRKIESRALALLKKVEVAMLRLKSYQADCYTTITRPKTPDRPMKVRRDQARLYAAKPNKMRYDSWRLSWDEVTRKWKRDSKLFCFTFVCDGRKNVKQFGEYYRTDDRTSPDEMGTILEPWDGFYSAESSPHGAISANRSEGELLELRRAGRENVDGTVCDKVFAHTKTSYAGQGQEAWSTWFVGRDGLVRRRVERIEFDGKRGYTRNDVIRNIRLNRRIEPSVFTYTPPPGVISKAEYERRHPPPALLTLGSVAPDFTARGIDNKPVRLSDFKGSVVVLDFWASWCMPCVASMPHTQDVASKLQKEGLPVVVLAVDDSEDRNAFAGFVKALGTKFAALTFVHVPPKTDVSGKLFHVQSIPTQYVLDKNGVIRASLVGYSGPTPDLEKAVRAALATSTQVR